MICDIRPSTPIKNTLYVSRAMDGNIPKMVSKFIKDQRGLVILIVGVIVALVVTYLFRNAHKEGFGNFLDSQNAFTLNQRDYFWNKFNRGLVYNSGLDGEMKDGVARLMEQPDVMFTNKTAKTDIFKYFTKDPSPGIAKAEAECSSQSQPSLLPQRGPEDRTGCGWWYIDDDNKPSRGARGADTGPFDEEFNKKFPGGKWTWDLVLAQKLEDAKLCRKIKSCDVADLVPGKCGYCLSTSTGIPIDSFGRAKYPTDQRLNCGEKAITRGSDCPKPEPPPTIVKPDGTVVIPPPPPAICDPVGGRLTRECLIMLAQGAGCTDDGGLLNVLKGDSMGYYKGNGDNAMKFRKANTILLEDCKIPFVSAYYGDGICDREGALQYYARLSRAVSSGATTRCRAASGFLVRGTPFDPCDYDPTQSGPFELYCLQRNFREAGCQPAGSEYPTQQNKSFYDVVTYQKSKDYMKQLHRDMLENPSVAVQNSATKKCLGVDIQPMFQECGDKTGCEVLWYRWDYEWDFPERKVTHKMFYGRELRKTWPDFNTGGDFNPYNKIDRVAMHLRGQIVSKKTRSSKFWVQTDDGVAMKADNTLVLRSFWDQGPTSYQSQGFTLRDNTPTSYNVYWYENYGGATFSGKLLNETGGYDPIPEDMLVMKVASGYPLCRWDLYMGNYDDRNLVLGSQPLNLRFGVMDGKKCAMFDNPQSAIQIFNPVRGGAFHTFAYMVNVRDVPSYWSRLFSLRQGPTNCDAGYTHGNSTTIEGGVCQDGRLWMGTKPAGQGWTLWNHTPPNTIQKNKWTHIAFVYDMDWRSCTVYANGVKIQTVTNNSANTDFFDNLECSAVAIGVGHYAYGCNGQPIMCGLAWAHWFDYALNENEVKNDMNMGFTKSSAYAESRDTGWRARF